MPCRSDFIARAFAFSVAAGLCLVFSPVFAEDAVLLASTVPGYVPGMIVSPDNLLNVPEGASVTLLFESGEVLRLGGPFQGRLGQQPRTRDSPAAMLADLFRTHGVDATVIGGTRSTGPARSFIIDDVQINPQRSGTYCLEPATSVWIARPPGGSHLLELRRDGSSRTLDWPSGAERVEWPADVPIEDGSRFDLASNGAVRATITFRAMPSDAGAGASMVAHGILLGCHDQFDDELRAVSRSMVRPELWMTTDRGRRPAYRRGEPVTVTVVTSVDGYLYCVARGKDGRATSVMPAEAAETAPGRASDALSVAGSQRLTTLTAGPGLQQIRCWLADRDILPQLSHAMLLRPGEDVPGQLGGARIQADSLSIQVE